MTRIMCVFQFRFVVIEAIEELLLTILDFHFPNPLGSIPKEMRESTHEMAERGTFVSESAESAPIYIEMNTRNI